MNILRNLSLGKRIHLLGSALILLFLLVICFLLFQFRGNLQEARRQEIRHLVESSWHILEFHAQQGRSGILSPAEARRRALEVIRSQRFEKGNYLWVSDLSGTMLVHPADPALEGRDLLDFRESSGRALFSEMVEMVHDRGEGFIDYSWPRPYGSEPVGKVGFVKGVPAWGWVIGAGYYMEDIDGWVLRASLLAGSALVPVIGVAVLLLYYLARSISVPMREAVTMIEALERGELGQRLRLEQRDEVGRMARSLDAFADSLQHEILIAFDHLARGDFSFKARGLIRVPLAQTNKRLNALVAELHAAVGREQEGRAKYEALIDAIGEGVAIFDPELRFTYQNQAHIEIVGHRVGEPCSLAEPRGEHVCSECALALSLADGNIHRMERVVRSGDRQIFTEATASPVRGADGEIVSVIEIARDVTARKLAEAALLESEARYHNFFRDNHAVMLVIDPATATVIDANPSAAAFYGYSLEQLLGMKVTSISMLDSEEIRSKMESALEGRGYFQVPHRLATGDVRDVEVYAGPVQVEGRQLLYSIIHDVTERKRAEERVEYLAFHDPLTGLANRSLLEDRLAQLLTSALRYNKRGALFSVDLDRFKLINNSLGHHGGDLLLQEVAARLLKLARSTDTICRSGGDEFIMLFSDLEGPAEAAQMAEKVLSSFTLPFDVLGQEVFITPSIGVGLFPGDGTDLVNLIRNAEAAMYAAKKQGRNTFRFFKSELMAAAQERLQLENNLRRAVENGELRLHYQPQFDAASGRLIGVEALARWYHPPKGWISPGEFIPLAEETGLIEQLGAWVLREACEQNRRWQQEGYAPIRMAVNVSGRQFRQAEFVDIVDRVLADTGLDPRFLEVEVTENIVMENVDETIMTLTDLKSRNISLAIDDFGTGYSSLSYLRQFPIDRLKIDRSFVAYVTSNPDDAAIASAIIGLARTLNLEVVAEGVETAEQALFLRERNCNTLQGYYYGRPAPPEEILPCLQGDARAKAWMNC